jgi:hypothetical protein
MPMNRFDQQGHRRGIKSDEIILRHQERRRQQFRENSRQLRSAALERAREAANHDGHDEEVEEVLMFPHVVCLGIVYIVEVLFDHVQLMRDWNVTV